MKTMKKVLVSMAMFLLLANPVAVFATGNDNGSVGDIIVSSANNNVNSNTANADANSTATATGGNASATGGNSNATLNYTERMQAPGFVPLQYASGARTEILASAEVDVFAAGISRQSVSFYEEKGGDLINIKMAYLGNAGKTDFVTFDFSGRRVSGMALATGSQEIDSRKAVGVMMFIAKEAMDMGGDFVQISATRRIDVKSNSRGVGVGWNPLCLLGISGGFSGGSTREEDGKVVIRFTIWKVTQPQVVAEKKPCDDCGDLSAVFTDLAMYQQKIAGCHFFCAENLKYRVKSAECNIELYACTRDHKYLRAAENDLYWALKNYESPKAVNAHTGEKAAESLLLYRRAIILKPTVLQAQGKSHEAQVHATKYGVEHWGSDFVPAGKNK